MNAASAKTQRTNFKFQNVGFKNCRIVRHSKILSIVLPFELDVNAASAKTQRTNFKFQNVGIMNCRIVCHSKILSIVLPF